MRHQVHGIMKAAAWNIALMLLLGAGTQAANAQEQSQRGSKQQIEEIVVTASKRGQSLLQDIPLAVTALQGNSLKEAGQMNFMDYFTQVPGLTVNNQGPGDKQYIIRGIQSAGAGTASVYFDEIVITGEGEGDFGRQPDINTYDLERIEVLRGPQGTTFGSSSLAGTIRFLPNKPQFDQFAAEVTGGLSTTSHSSDIGYRTAAMINLPLIEDKFAIRVAAIKDFKEGYIDNKFQDDVNNQDTNAIRGMLGWRINDELTFSALAMYQKLTTDSRNFFNDSTFFLPLSPTLKGQPLPEKYYQAVLTNEAGFDDKIEMYNAKLEWEKTWGTFTATTSYFNRLTDGRRATSAASEVLFGLAADQHPAYIRGDKDRTIWSDEIRFASHWDSPVQLLSGVFYQKEDRDYAVTYVFTDPATGRSNQASQPPAADRRQNGTQEEKAFFSEVEWTPIPRLRITGGLRWFDIDIDSQANVITAYIYNPGPGLGPLLKFGQKDTIYKGNASFDITDDVMIYAQYAEGYRGGGANDQSPEQFTDVIIPAGFGSDSLENYELGLKTAWMERRLTFDVAAYDIEWSDIQVEQRATNSQGLSFAYRGNGGKARVKGLELSMSAFPTDGLSVNAGMTFTHARLLEDFPIPANGRDGDKIPNTPEFTAFLSARYEHPIIDGRFTGFVGGDWSYQGDTSNRFTSSTDMQARRLSAYDVLNLRAGIDTADGWEAILAVNNVFDADDIISYTFDFGFPPIPGVRFLPDNKVRPWPRQIALTFRKQFD